MEYDTILVRDSVGGITITLNRLEHQNSLNHVLLKEMNDVLDLAEQDANCRIVVLEGQKGVFCTGMDFAEVTSSNNQAAKRSASDPYMETIKRFTLIPKIIISVIDGQVMAGGVGLVAASDIVIATPRSQFSLSEALWGLLPAMVTPYLIRRIGFQNAYRMTLTTMPVFAQQALNMGLVDEICETPHENIRRLWLRLSKLETATIKNMKQYFRKMWLITEQIEQIAVSEISRLSSNPQIVENIVNYVKYQKFPWDND